MEAMKTYQPQYNGVDYVSETVSHIVNLAQLDAPQGRGGEPSERGADGAITNWTDILIRHPSCYLRLALTMDLSLSKERVPDDSDFPINLRGFFNTGFSTLRLLLGQGKGYSSVPRAVPSLTLGSTGGERVGTGIGSPMMTLNGGEHMREFLPNDQMLHFGMQVGVPVDMDLDRDQQIVGAEAVLSDEGSQSPESAAADNENSPETAHESHGDDYVDNSHEANGLGLQPFTVADMELLGSHVVDTFMMLNESPPSSDGNVYTDLFGEVGQGTSIEWSGQPWGAEAGEPRYDQGTAKALM
jgi:hypothetical protein